MHSGTLVGQANFHEGGWFGIMKRWFVNVGLVVATIVLSLVLMELALGAMGLGVPYLSGPGRLYDDKLLYRLPAHYADGIDALGFRNDRVDEHYDVVILGDSHTYGYNAANNQTWPARLHAVTGLTAYNFGLGGYGVAQYRMLAELGVDKFSPRLLVVTVFLGNDLADTCYIANRLPHWRDEYVRNGFAQPGCGDRFDPGWSLRRQAVSRWQSFSGWLRGTRLGSMLMQHAWLPLRDEFGFRFGMKTADRLYLDTPDIRTVIASHYAHGDVDSAAGLRIAEKLLLQIKVLVEQHGAKLALFIVPSKPSALLEYVEGRNITVPPAVRSDVEAERRYEGELIGFADRHDIPWANARSALMNAVVSSDGPLYPSDADDHPTARGYQVYTDAFIAGMDRYGGLKNMVDSKP